MFLSTRLCGHLLLADAGRSALLITLNLTADHQALPDGGDEQRNSADQHDGAKKALLGVVVELALDAVVAEKEEAAAGSYAQPKDLDNL